MGRMTSTASPIGWNCRIHRNAIRDLIVNFGAVLSAFLLLVLSIASGQANADLGDAFARVRAEAIHKAGSPQDFSKRALLLHDIYRDSEGNHRFPLVALHGALWGERFFRTTGPVGEAISFRYFYSPAERVYRQAMLRQFANAFADINRSVFIDTYTNYFFTKAYGLEKGAGTFVHPRLLSALNRVHAAVSGREPPLSEVEKKEIFKIALYEEQESTVGPRIAFAISNFDCPILTRLALHPIVRFAYFPKGQYFFFRDFSNRDERIIRAIQSYDIANAVGWTRVEASIH